MYSYGVRLSFAFMELITRNSPEGKFAELRKASFFIDTIDAGADVLANVYFNQYDGLILYEEDIHADFFDLKTGFAGELLQKASNFRLRIMIIGDFSLKKSKSLQDFIRESNRTKFICFIESFPDNFI